MVVLSEGKEGSDPQILERGSRKMGVCTQKDVHSLSVFLIKRLQCRRKGVHVDC